MNSEASVDVTDVEILWNYMKLQHEVMKCDVMLVFGNLDPRSGEYAAELFKQGYAPYAICSGSHGHLTNGKFQLLEAELFRNIMIDNGCDGSKIHLEKEAQNTGENVTNCYKKIIELGLDLPKSVLIVQTPPMERRVQATFQKQWPRAPDVRLIVTSPPMAMADFPSRDTGTLVDLARLLLGCLRRIDTYPARGYQVEQQVPAQVREAYSRLLAVVTPSDHDINPHC